MACRNTFIPIKGVLFVCLFIARFALSFAKQPQGSLRRKMLNYNKIYIFFKKDNYVNKINRLKSSVNKRKQKAKLKTEQGDGQLKVVIYH